MDSRNTSRWLAAGALLSGGALATTGTVAALVDFNSLLRLVNILDIIPT